MSISSFQRMLELTLALLYNYDTVSVYSDIEREKKEIVEAEEREQVLSDDEEVHGFW